jgi:hypothetical protein
MPCEGGGGKALRIALAALAALAIAAGSAVAYFLLDTNRLKAPLERWVSARTGRDLTIGGDLRVQLGRYSSLSIGGVELANAGWASEPVMVKADRVSLSVDLASVLEGPLVIEELGIAGARIRLEKGAGEAGNWKLSERDGEEASGLGEGLPIAVRRLRVDDCLVIYLTPERSDPLRLEIASLTQVMDADGFLDLSGRGALQDRPIRIEGSVGPFAALLEARGFRHELAITIGETRVRSRGSVGDLTELEGLDLVLDIHEPDAGFYADLFGVPGALTGPIELEAAFSRHRPGIGAEVAGTVGGFEIALSGRVERPRGLDGLDLDVHLSGPDLGVVGGILGVPWLPAGPFDAGGRLRRSGGALVIREAELSAGGAVLSVDAEFDKLPDPDGGTVLASLTGPDLGRFDRLLGPLPGLAQQAFEARASLTQARDGDERIEASIAVGPNRLALGGILGPYPEFAGSRFQVDLEGPELGDLAGLLGLHAAVTGPYRASGGLTWKGAALTIERLLARAGPLELRGSGSLANLPSLRGSALRLTAAGPDLFAVGEWMGTSALPHQPYSFSGRLGVREKGMVVEDIGGRIGAIRFQASARIGDPGRLADAELDFGVEGPGVGGLMAEPLGLRLDDAPFELSGTLRRRESAIQASNLRYRSADASISVDGILGAPPSFAGMRLTVAAEGPSLRAILPDVPIYTPPDRRFRLTGRIERPGDRALVFDDLRLESGGAAATASGVWSFPSHPEEVRLVLRASGSGLDDLGEWEGLALPALPFALEVEIEGAPGSVALPALSATWGESDLRGHATLDFAGKPRVTATVHSNRLDLNPFLRGREDRAEGADEPAAKGGRVIPDRDLPLEGLRSADLSVDLSASNLVAGSETLEHLELDLTVRDGALHIEPLEVIGSDGTALLNLSVTPGDGRPELDLSLSTRNVRLVFLGGEGQAAESLAPYDVEMSLASRGGSTREIAAGLSGSVRIESTGGLIVKSRIAPWFDDVWMQLFAVILPFFEKDPYTRLECAVLDATLEDGVLRAKPGLVARTDRINLFARGKVDLASERVDIDFRTEARKGIGISVEKILSPYVKIGGTLREPRLTLDATGAVVSGAGAWASGGISLALPPLWDRIRGTRNPCVRMLEPAAPE